MRFHLVADYKKLGFSQGLVSLWSGRLLLDFGLNIFILFLPIFLYQYFRDFNIIILWYFSHSLGYFLLAPLGSRLMNKIGLKKSLLIGVLFRIPYFYAWFQFDSHPIASLVIASLSLIFLRSTFWLPFHTDSAKFSSSQSRGRQFGIIFSLSSLLAIIAPIIGGFLMDSWGFALLSVVALIVTMTSLVPFMFLPETKEQMTWSYGETMRYFFHPFNRRMVTAYMSDGAVTIVNGVFWPLFIFSILNEEFKAVGLITGGILLIGVIVRLVIGDLLDKFQKVKLVRMGTILNSSAWLVKILVTTAFQVFLASIYHTLALIILRTSLDTLIYEKAADRGHYIDEYTLIKEMALHLGKLVCLLIVFGLLAIFPLQASFVLAAVAALAVSLLH